MAVFQRASLFKLLLINWVRSDFNLRSQKKKKVISLQSISPERFEQLRALDATCTTAIQRFFCLRFLPPCHSYESQSAAGTMCAEITHLMWCVSQGTVDLPIGACYNSCLDMRSICNSTFTNLNITLPTWCGYHCNPCTPFHTPRQSSSRDHLWFLLRRWWQLHFKLHKLRFHRRCCYLPSFSLLLWW